MEQYLTPMGPTKLHVNPIFEISPLEPRFSEWLVFEGLSVDESGRQHYLDATVAFKRAILNCIDYLHKFGYTKEQVISPLCCLYNLISVMHLDWSVSSLSRVSCTSFCELWRPVLLKQCLLYSS